MLTYTLGNKIDGIDADGVVSCCCQRGSTFGKSFLLFPLVSSILMSSIPSNFLNCKYIPIFEEKIKVTLNDGS